MVIVVAAAAGVEMLVLGLWLDFVGAVAAVQVVIMVFACGVAFAILFERQCS